jgi:hypothetical protein
MKTTIGKSHKEVVKLPRNKSKSDFDALTARGYKEFIRRTGKRNITQAQRGQIIKKINGLAMETILKGQYNIRFPYLGILTLIRVPYNHTPTHSQTSRVKYFPKIHFYFQVTGEENRIMLYDMTFNACRKYRQRLEKETEKFIDSLKIA